MDEAYERIVPDYDFYRQRKVPGVEAPPPSPAAAAVSTTATAANHQDFKPITETRKN
jgi:hypothetical protein